MIVEVGTSDFRTEAGKQDGLFIEPVKYYFDRLPDCRKLNIAVSNEVGVTFCTYLTLEDIQQFELPDWVRGCNRLGGIHPTVEKLLIGKGISLDVIRRQEVQIDTLVNILEREKIFEIDFLKIDTEGHDCVILEYFFENWKHRMPDKIQFEANVLSDVTEVGWIIDLAQPHGYFATRVKTDIILYR